jgi:hypothetical protein
LLYHAAGNFSDSLALDCCPTFSARQKGPKLQSPITIGNTMKLQRGSDQHMIFRTDADRVASRVDASAPGRINTDKMRIVWTGAMKLRRLKLHRQPNK